MSKTAARSVALSAIDRMNRSPALIDSRDVSKIQSDFIHMSSCEDDGYQEKALDIMRESLCQAYGGTSPAASKPFAFVAGTAIIPVHGTLINRYDGYYFGYITGYNFIRRQFMQAQMDDDVERIIFDVNSGGGQASGCFELSDEIYSMRSQKPSMAIVDSQCYSGAYALASAADEIVVTPSGGAGSIGVIGIHIDRSKLMEDLGLKVTMIIAGARKADGNPFEPLQDDVKKDMQADIDQTYDMFVELVARNRDMDEKAVRDTEARCYSAQDALEIGLIDAVATPTQAVTGFVYGPSGSEEDEPNEDEIMPAANKTTQPEAQTTTKVDNAQQTQDVSAARTEAAVAERSRIASIINCEAAKDRPKMAAHLAFNTEMTTAEAEAMLNVAGVETQAAAPVNPANPADPKSTEGKQEGSHFLNAMNNGKHPEVGANGDAEKKVEEDDLEAHLTAMGHQFN